MDLSEKTKIPLWSVLVSVPAVFGFVYWISFIAYAAAANSKDIEDLKQTKDMHYKILMEIRTDVAIIKERTNKRSN